MKLKALLRPLLILGVLLCVYAFLQLKGLPDYAQYSFTLTGTQADALKTLEGAGLTDTAVMTGTKYSQSVDSVSGVTVFMYGPDEDGLVPIPVMSGSGLSRSAVADAEKVCVLDTELAFKLFGDTDASGQSVDIGSTAYTVVGTARFSRGVGDTDSYAAWVPFGSSESLTPDLVTVVSKNITESDISQYFPGGTYVKLSKEKLRAYILPGCIALCILLTLLRAALALWMKLARRFGQGVLRRSREMYTFKNVLHSLPGSLILLVSAAAGIWLCVILLNVFIQPVYVFTEWIPEDLVSAASIIARFRELCAAAAKPVRYVTREYACIRFYAGMLRWGCVCMLVSVVRGTIKKKLNAGINQA